MWYFAWILGLPLNEAIRIAHAIAKGNLTKVDKTWGYVRGGDGKLRIVLHHSSLPYSP